ncbi:hypothetical protein EV356DRAFT_575243 [Viridothelium virens]|uniref:Heterokaryon incompatibility domain-containing protein n=1 Tax=Viridothelium virens TaxID=1048519 RepID=A0A6A6HD12_VIRVR|nr:hypothetical protein EV356DRAFT_575243 [Viridothelium virens]
MDQDYADKFLKALWIGTGSVPKCSHCGEGIGSEELLARTCSLESHVIANGQLQWLPSQRIQVPALSEVILVFTRHIECLFRSTRYIPISHVWPRQVANAQYQGPRDGTSYTEVVRIIREIPVQIYRGIASSLIEGQFEIWRDYLSVPQWKPALKDRIIQAIPQIFERAVRTVAYLPDVRADDIAAMRCGASSYEVCRGISNICNTKWFSRTWTAMELTRSRNLQIMLADFTLLKDHDVQLSLVKELQDTWSTEIEKQGNAHATEQMVGMGNNLVPWQLGPLDVVRIKVVHGFQTEFGTAHDVLARRCVTLPRDFFHALLGMLRTGLKESQLSPDTEEALLQVGRRCIRQGDFSPLFMIPSSAQEELKSSDLQGHGFYDLSTFAIGTEILPPTFKDVRFRSGNPIIQAEHVGKVQHIIRVDWTKRAWYVLSVIISTVLSYTGLDVDRFVANIARLYAQEPEKIARHLETTDQMRALRLKLKEVQGQPVGLQDEKTVWIAEAMGLSNLSLENKYHMSPLSPMNFVEAHGGSLHLGGCAALTVVKCRKCQQEFFLRVALLEAEHVVLNTEAYRVPGLKYQYTTIRGAGFLLTDKRVVGRSLWGSSTCTCPKFADLEFPLNALPLPHSNEYPYGSDSTSKECHYLKLEKRIKFGRLQD